MIIKNTLKDNREEDNRPILTSSLLLYIYRYSLNKLTLLTYSNNLLYNILYNIHYKHTLYFIVIVVDIYIKKARINIIS